MGPSSNLDALEMRETLFHMPGIEPRFLSRPAYTLLTTILTSLCRHLLGVKVFTLSKNVSMWKTLKRILKSQLEFSFKNRWIDSGRNWIAVIISEFSDLVIPCVLLNVVSFCHI